MCPFLLGWFLIDYVPLLEFFRSSLWSRRIEDLELKSVEAGSFWVSLAWMCMGGLLPGWSAWLTSFGVAKNFQKNYLVKNFAQSLSWSYEI